MRGKELKKELDDRGVSWRGVAFEKEALERLVESSRAAAAPQPRCCPPTESDAQAGEDTAADANTAAKSNKEDDSTATVSSVQTAANESTVATPAPDEAAKYKAAYMEAYADARKLRVKELRERLAQRQVGWADLFEKEELVARLAGLIAESALLSRSGKLIPGKTMPLTGAELRVEMADDRTPLLVDVYATWCEPCKMISPMLDALAAKLGSRARVAKLDSDAESKLARELRVEAFPTIIFFSGGREVYRLEGVPPGTEALEALAKQHLGVDM